MKNQLFRSIAVALLALFFIQTSVATCGGGNGGGGGSNTPVYIVPWKVRKPKDPPAMGLVLYWFPASNNEVNNSSLRQSRALSLYASQCVSMELADTHVQNADKLVGES